MTDCFVIVACDRWCSLFGLVSSIEYSILDNFSLTAGNAGNILVSINGFTRGKVGKKGEIIDSLIINSDFNN